MCGRYAFYSPDEAVRHLFGVENDLGFEPSYNITPTRDVPVVREQDGHRRAELLHWGLIPFWANDKAIGNRMINARAETVAEKPAFRAALKRRRCLVLANGFYEWQKVADGKQPWYFSLSDERPMALAGLWESWDKGDEPLESCTIITTTANALLAPVHHRMPVILGKDAQDAWLGVTDNASELQPMLRPYEGEDLAARAVSRRVNSPANQGPGLLDPVEPPSQES